MARMLVRLQILLLMLCSLERCGIPAACGQDAASGPPDATSAPSPVEPSRAESASVPGMARIEIEAEDLFLEEITGRLRARNVRVQYREGVITAERAEGNLREAIVFRGNARIETPTTVHYADTITFYPNTRQFRLNQFRSTLQPELFGQNVLDPVFARGKELLGARSGDAQADRCDGTTCTDPRHRHYELRFRSAELIPNRRLRLRRVAVYLFGQRLVVLPELVIPLDRQERRPRSDYAPELGRNAFEGYFARFPYAFAIGAAAAAFLRVDVTERLGPGFRVEQEYLAGKQQSAFNTGGPADTPIGFASASEGTLVQASGYGRLNPRLPRFGTGIGPQNGGLLTLQGYFADGLRRNFNGSFRHQQYIGSNNRVGVTTELRRNSFLSFQAQDAWNTRLQFNHTDPAHGVNADINLTHNVSTAGAFRSEQTAATYRHTFEFDVSGANRNHLSIDLDVTRYLSIANAVRNRTMRLNGQFQFQHFSRDYSFQAIASKNVPIGPQSAGSAFGTLERLPELQLAVSTYNFQRGWLKRLPLQMELGVGRYSEPGSEVNTERVTIGLSFQEAAILRGTRTEIVTGGGFEQRVYGDGAAQYVLRNTTRLRQRLGSRSGLDLNYQYQEPAGGTPFLFDTFGRTHTLSAEAGYLDDRHFQFTVRAGYDFLGTSRDRPWQSIGLRLMWRPGPSTRLDALGSFDPNTGRFFQVTQQLRLRGRRDFALDLTALYDPGTGKYSQVNSQFDIPIGRTWRFAGLVRYNGFRGLFESTSLQLTHRWDCMEATLTYTDTPLGFRNERQLFLTVRLTAFPFFRAFARGPAGDVLGTGFGSLY